MKPMRHYRLPRERDRPRRLACTMRPQNTHTATMPDFLKRDKSDGNDEAERESGSCAVNVEREQGATYHGQFCPPTRQVSDTMPMPVFGLGKTYR